jgi:tetratricopeptide (TPR) repeat protein
MFAPLGEHMKNKQLLRPLVQTLLGMAMVHSAVATRAEEPSAKFIERLKEEGLYDQALKYLDIGVKRNRLPEGMKSEVDLERILLLQMSLKEVRNEKALADKLAAIEKGFKDFLASSPNHPRRGETLLKLADMYLARGGQVLEEAKSIPDAEGGAAKGAELKGQARASFQQAYDIFGQAIAYLKPVLEGMQGANVKPNETERLALREKLQTEYRQGQILQAITTKFLAETYETNSSDWRSRLEEADKRLGEVIDKSSKQAGAKYLSLLNRAHVQALLGQIDAARESYNRVAENEEPGVFRTWRVQAVSGIVRLDSSPASGKYEAAVMRGEEQLKQGDVRERDKPEWQELQLSIAKARIAWIQSLDSKSQDGAIRNIKREARETLQNLAKRPGATQKQAVELLKNLGIEAKVAVDNKLPEVKTFDEAIKAARSRFDRAETAESTLQILNRQLQQAAPSDQPPIQQQIDSIVSDAVRDREQAIELNQKAFNLYRDNDSREDLLQARFLQSYLYLQLKRYREAIAIADVILRTNRGSETAPKAGAVALQAFVSEIDASPSETKGALIPELEKLARKLLEIAPGTATSDQAIDTLARLKIREGDWDGAETYVGLKQTAGGPLEFLLGRVRWSQYRQAMFAHRQEKTSETPEDQALRDKALKFLTVSWNALEVDEIDKGSLEGTNDLVSIYLQAGQLDEAQRVLKEPGKGAIAQVESIADVDPKLKLETQRMNLQAMVQSAAQGRSALTTEQVSAAIDQMKELSDRTGDPSMLTRSLMSLASDLQNQLEANKDPAQQAKLADAFKILIDQLVGLSSDAATLESAGSAMNALSANLEKMPSLAAKVPSLMQSAERAFDKMQSLPESELQKIQRKPEEVTLNLAIAKRGAGKFEEAHQLFTKALQKNASNITIQIEAARNLQQWSNGKDVEKLKQAMLGTEQQPNKKNLIWGWGQIAQITSKYPNFQKQFFDARWNVARCRSLLGDAENDPTKKQKLYETTIGDITQTLVRFPELGGQSSYLEFDRLLREVQQKASKPVSGLAGINVNAPPGPK